MCIGGMTLSHGPLSESAWVQVQADDIPKHEERHRGWEPHYRIRIVPLLVALAEESKKCAGVGPDV